MDAIDYLAKAKELCINDKKAAGLRSHLGLSDLHVGLRHLCEIAVLQKNHIEKLEQRLDELERSITAQSKPD